jgi:hypothetical protein
MSRALPGLYVCPSHIGVARCCYGLRRSGSNPSSAVMCSRANCPGTTKPIAAPSPGRGVSGSATRFQHCGRPPRSIPALGSRPNRAGHGHGLSRCSATEHLVGQVQGTGSTETARLYKEDQAGNR